MSLKFQIAMHIFMATILIFGAESSEAPLPMTCSIYAVAILNVMAAFNYLGEIAAERKMRKQGLK